MLPLAWRAAWVGGAAVILLAILLGSLLPGPVVAVVSTWDKLEHAVAYGVLTLWLAGLFPPARCLWAGLASFAAGAAVELLQAFVPVSRVGEAADLLANGAGIALALALAAAGMGGWAQRVERRFGAVPPGGPAAGA